MKTREYSMHTNALNHEATILPESANRRQTPQTAAADPTTAPTHRDEKKQVIAFRDWKMVFQSLQYLEKTSKDNALLDQTETDTMLKWTEDFQLLREQQLPKLPDGSRLIEMLLNDDDFQNALAETKHTMIHAIDFSMDFFTDVFNAMRNHLENGSNLYLRQLQKQLYQAGLDNAYQFIENEPQLAHKHVQVVCFIAQYFFTMTPFEHPKTNFFHGEITFSNDPLSQTLYQFLSADIRALLTIFEYANPKDTSAQPQKERLALSDRSPNERQWIAQELSRIDQHAYRLAAILTPEAKAFGCLHFLESLALPETVIQDFRQPLLGSPCEPQRFFEKLYDFKRNLNIRPANASIHHEGQKARITYRTWKAILLLIQDLQQRPNQKNLEVMQFALKHTITLPNDEQVNLSERLEKEDRQTMLTEIKKIMVHSTEYDKNPFNPIFEAMKPQSNGNSEELQQTIMRALYDAGFDHTHSFLQEHELGLKHLQMLSFVVRYFFLKNPFGYPQTNRFHDGAIISEDTSIQDFYKAFSQDIQDFFKLQEYANPLDETVLPQKARVALSARQPDEHEWIANELLLIARNAITLRSILTPAAIMSGYLHFLEVLALPEEQIERFRQPLARPTLETTLFLKEFDPFLTTLVLPKNTIEQLSELLKKSMLETRPLSQLQANLNELPPKPTRDYNPFLTFQNQPTRLPSAQNFSLYQDRINQINGALSLIGVDLETLWMHNPGQSAEMLYDTVCNLTDLQPAPQDTGNFKQVLLQTAQKQRPIMPRSAHPPKATDIEEEEDMMREALRNSLLDYEEQNSNASTSTAPYYPPPRASDRLFKPVQEEKKKTNQPMEPSATPPG